MIIIGKGLAVTNEGYLTPIVHLVDGKKTVKRMATLTRPFTIKGNLKEGDKAKCLFRMPGGRLIGFDCEIKSFKENMELSITGEYTDNIEGLIKKIENGCN